MGRIWCALGLGLSLAITCGPTTGQPVLGIPSDWKQIARDDWTIFVPAEWMSDGSIRYDAPRRRLVITRPLDATPTALPPTAAPSPFRPPGKLGSPSGGVLREVTLIVSRFRDGLDLQSATDVYVRRECFHCPPDVRNERLQVDLEGRPATLTEIVRGDGSTEWHLVVQSYCDTFVVDVLVGPGDVDDLTDTVDRILVSFRIKEDTWPFGPC